MAKNTFFLKLKWRFWLSALLGLLLLLACIGGWIELTQSNALPIKKVQVYTDYQYFDRAALRKTILPYVDQGFFQVDVSKLKQQLLHLPWSDQVAVRRVWPNKVIIKILPKKAVALWNNHQLLSAQGNIFRPGFKTFPSDLVQLNGPQGEALSVWQQYVQMQKILEPLHLTIVQVDLSPRHAWQFTLENGIQVILGRLNVLSRLRRFVEVYPNIIANRATFVAKIDMRYSKGVAVKFKHS